MLNRNVYRSVLETLSGNVNGSVIIVEMWNGNVDGKCYNSRNVESKF